LRESAFGGRDVGGFDLAAEEPAGKWIVNDNIDFVFSAAWDEFRLDGAGCSRVLAQAASKVECVQHLLMALYIAW
jgi:hypothetical protein